MSPRSMRLASSTSCAAVSSDTRPIERRYSRSESRLGSTVRSISGFLRRVVLCAGAACALRRRLGGRRLAAPRVRRRPPTRSMPCSTRYACSSRTCSFVTSTSSRQAVICSNVRKPRSWPSAMSWRSSSTRQIGASSASRTRRSSCCSRPRLLPEITGRPLGAPSPSRPRLSVRRRDVRRLSLGPRERCRRWRQPKSA